MKKEGMRNEVLQRYIYFNGYLNKWSQKDFFESTFPSNTKVDLSICLLNDTFLSISCADIDLDITKKNNKLISTCFFIPSIFEIVKIHLIIEGLR